jgi:hypothetical protein
VRQVTPRTTLRRSRRGGIVRLGQIGPGFAASSSWPGNGWGIPTVGKPNLSQISLVTTPRNSPKPRIIISCRACHANQTPSGGAKKQFAWSSVGCKQM